MRFVLFTEKTVSQCMRDLHERMEAKPTKTRPELGGWIQKSGTFSVTTKSRVIGRLQRSTRLSAKAKRESGVTVIRGRVADGVNPNWLRILMIAVAALAALLVLSNEPMLALVLLMFSVFAYVPLRGDYVNSDVLLMEIEKTLKASPKPPKK